MRLSKIFFALLLVTNLSFGQSQDSGNKIQILNKNLINGTIGIYPMEFYGTLMVNYERMLVQLSNSFINSFWIRVGAGPWVWWSGNGINYISSISLLTGKKGFHLDTGVGLLLSYDSDEKKFDPLVKDNYLGANFGLRLQKPGRSFVFRTGIGWPEFLYLGIGFSF